MTRTLRGRVALAATAAAAVVLAAIGIALVTTFAARERNDLDRGLSNRADTIVRPAERALDGDGPFGGPFGGREIGPIRQLLADPSAHVRLIAGEQVVFDNGVAPSLPSRAQEGFATVEAGGEEWRVLVRALPPDGRARVQVGAALEPMQDRISRVRTFALVAALLGVVITGLAARGLAGYALQPLAALRGAAARVSGTRDLTTRLPSGGGPDEVDDLANSLNAMLARLEGSAGETEAALQAARRFTADAGHELRTPLTSLRANVHTLLRNPGLPEAERERVLSAVAADEARLAALVEGLQSLARGDAGAGRRDERLDLADLADAAIASARSRHPAVAFELHADGAAAVQGDEGALRAILDNLLENAARHGAGRVEVFVARDRDQVRLWVDDDGPGIPAAERDRVFDRFARGAGARGPGSGLGLAIVAQQAALHGGWVELGDAPAGGARFTVQLPAAPSTSGRGH